MAEDLARYYHILGLEPDASADAVKMAYRDCVDAWHPDRFTHSPERQQRAQARLQLINEAYTHLRRQPTVPPKAPPPHEPKPDPPPGAKARSQAEHTRARARQATQSTTQQRQYNNAQEGTPDPAETPPARRSWLELSRESRFTVTVLYFSFIGIVVCAGCGISLGGMYFGTLGAICGILVSPLAGLTLATLSAMVSAAIAERVGGTRGNVIGGAFALLFPGTTCGAVLVWSITRAILGDVFPPMLDVTLGGVMGAGCGVALGAWTGKAITMAMGELKSA